MPSLVSFGPMVVVEKMVISIWLFHFANISHWRRCLSIIWTNLNSQHNKTICKCGWNWSYDAGEDVKKFWKLMNRQTYRRTKCDRKVNIYTSALTQWRFYDCFQAPFIYIYHICIGSKLKVGVLNRQDISMLIYYVWLCQQKKRGGGVKIPIIILFNPNHPASNPIGW